MRKDDCRELQYMFGIDIAPHGKLVVSSVESMDWPQSGHVWTSM